MKYAVKIQNHLKGWFGVAVFNTRKEAEECYELLNDIWHHPQKWGDEEDFNDQIFIDMTYDYAFRNMIAYEDEFRYNELDYPKMKKFKYQTNENGRITTYTDTISFVNYNYTYIPC